MGVGCGPRGALRSRWRPSAWRKGPLGEVAGVDDVVLCGCLDSFCDDVQSEIVCEFVDGGDDDFAGGAGEISDETTVDLENVDRQMGEVAQRRVSGAVVTECDPDSRPCEL